jgi:catechol 2,3-dioxygenase-like lactoylglutathione lyase family enzyme
MDDKRRVKVSKYLSKHPAPMNRQSGGSLMPMTDITGVDFVAIMTKDHDAAVKFYGETLGLPFVKKWGNMPGTEFQAGNLTLAVMQPDAFGFEWSPSSTMISLQVDDVAATRARLEAAGVEFRGEILDSGVCHQSFFTDPDGNPLNLHHRYAPKA